MVSAQQICLLAFYSATASAALDRRDRMAVIDHRFHLGPALENAFMMS
jgi:hypothetical protein